MDQEPLCHCYCGDSKPRDQLPLCKKNHKHTRVSHHPAMPPGDQHKMTKQKHNEEGFDMNGDTPEPGHILSIKEFTTLLHKKAVTGVFSYSAQVSTQRIDGEDEYMCSRIIGHVWEATGFQFTVHMSSFHLSLGKMANGHTDWWTVQCIYECCQMTASSNNWEKKPRTDPAQDKKGRDTQQMSCFTCGGLFYVTAQNGIYDCCLKHSLC